VLVLYAVSLRVQLSQSPAQFPFEEMDLIDFEKRVGVLQKLGQADAEAELVFKATELGPKCKQQVSRDGDSQHKPTRRAPPRPAGLVPTDVVPYALPK
jgi:hypothetical protein